MTNEPWVTADVIHKAVASVVSPGVREAELTEAVEHAMTVRVRGPLSLFKLAGAIGEQLGPRWYLNSSNVPRITDVRNRQPGDRSVLAYWPGIAWEPAPVDQDQEEPRGSAPS